MSIYEWAKTFKYYHSSAHLHDWTVWCIWLLCWSQAQSQHQRYFILAGECVWIITWLTLSEWQVAYCFVTPHNAQKKSTVSTCVLGLTLTVVSPPPEQKPKARPQPAALPQWPGWPLVPGLSGVVGRHVWGRRSYCLHPRQPGSCQPASGAINQPDKGPLTRYAVC